ncbi:MAG: crossover junction endodeoxyribonuclease RuvC [Candidatus Woykebacteria bacterium]
MIIVGIDPGTATTGWGAVEIKGEKLEIKNNKGNGLRLLDFGCILTKAEEEMPKRLLILRRELKKVLDKHKPQGLVVEKLFFGVNSRTAMAVGQARGVVMLVAAETKTPFHEYTGLEIKLEVANHGRSDKHAVRKAVKRLLGVTNIRVPRDQDGKQVNRFRDDAYDAVAAALCHLSKQNLMV